MRTLITMLLLVTLTGSRATADDEPKPEPKPKITAKLDQTQQSFARSIKRASAFTVTIETLGGTTAGSGKLFVKGKQPRRRGSFRQAIDASTTGVVVRKDGLIMTSLFNFNTKPQITTVILADGREFVAKLIARDFSKGLALLKVDADDLPVPEAVPVDEITTGQWAIALGRAYAGTSPSAHYGIISATRRISGKACQTDAPCSPVNYGGPLIDVAGRVVGVIVPLSTRGSGVGWYDSGIGFAVPLADIQRDLKLMIRAKELHPAFLGVSMDAKYSGPGARIDKVVPGSAAVGKLEPGDIVIRVGKRQVLNQFDLLFQIGKRYAGADVEIEIKRGDETFPITIQLGRRPKPKPRRPGSRPSAPGPQPRNQ